MLKELDTQLPVEWLLPTQNGAHSRAVVRSPPVELDLYESADALLEHSSRQGLPIPLMGAMPLFAGHRLYEGQHSDWALVNLAEDPMFHDRDGFPVPGQVLEHLRTIKRAGIEFDALYVAHEMEKGIIRPGDPLTREPLLPPPPQAVVQLSDRLGGVSEALLAVAAAPLVLATVGAAAALVAAPVVAVAVAACFTGDPILFGTIVAPGRAVRVGEPACWFLLDAWTYGQDG